MICRLSPQLARLTPENPVVTIENRVRSAKGEMRWMQFVNRATFDRAGRLVEVQSVGRDITDQRRVADELLRSEAHMRLAMSAAPWGTWEWDLVTDEVHWSDNLWRMFGLEPGQGKLDLETFRKATTLETGFGSCKQSKMPWARAKAVASVSGCMP
jgi:PAS domain-containing protein